MDASSESCHGEQKEIHGCNLGRCSNGAVAADCLWSMWSKWERCGCDGVQRRHREIVNDSRNGGQPCTGPQKQLQPCDGPCGRQGGAEDCKLTTWEPWSDCTKTCGGGQQYRTRLIVREPRLGGLPCEGRLDETRGCIWQDCPDSERTDCRWTDWTDWDACSVTCGDGETTRSRIIRVQPGNGGQLCPAHVSAETRHCTLRPCVDSAKQDCLWALWQDWSPCSESCGGGEKHRSRSIALQASRGGAGCEGVFEDYELCDQERCPSYGQDCEFGPWTPWSDCSATCQGHHKRARSIAVQKQLGGKPCTGSLEDTQPCNQRISCGVTSVDCAYSSWLAWSQCSRTCGGGLRQRRRSIEHHAQGDGRQCDGSTEEVAPCGAEVCQGQAPVDCAWHDWSDWSSCSQSCGRAQRRRERGIAREAAHDGKPCKGGDGQEVEPCHLVPCTQPAQVCEWASWGAWSDCHRGPLPVTCGGGQRKRNRYSEVKEEQLNRRGGMLDFGPTAVGAPPPPQEGGEARRDFERRLMLKLTAADCKEFEEQLETCAQDDCSHKDPVDCVWAAWQQWSTCPCSGMHERHRRIAAAAIAGGEPCEGPAVEAEPCISDCNAVPMQDCQFSPWTAWSACPVTCGGSYSKDRARVRYRVITRFEQGGGRRCDGGPVEIQPCALSPCPTAVDCQWGDWSELSACSASCGSGMASRSREIVRLPRNGGKPCERNVTMSIVACNTEACPSTIRDCELSKWNDWQDCSMPCGGGQQHRSRILLIEASEGGKPCEGDLEEFEECNTQPCRAVPQVDCTWGEWARWSACSALCNGHQERHRSILALAENGGTACDGPERIVRGCNLDSATCRAEAPKDCEIGPWSSWSHCSHKCDGGQQVRHREIQVYPANLGKPCSAALAENQPCNTQVCVGELGRHDCSWKPWEAWGACTRSCDSGERTRRRGIAAEAAGHGAACKASSSLEVEPCNTASCWTMAEVCAWSDWGSFGQCSRSCGSGQETRLRQKTWHSPDAAKELGLVPSRRLSSLQVECAGRQREIRPCGLTPCSLAEAPVNCLWRPWRDWGDCACSGLRTRERIVEMQALRGGVPCVGALEQSNSCEPSITCKSLNVDCELGLWTSWSACSVTCGAGQRYHTRTVIVHAQASGNRCEGGLEEVEACLLTPCGSAKDCLYTEWSQWSSCSRDCGGGHRSRSRDVASTAKNGGAECPKADLEEAGECNTQDCVEDAWGKIDCTWSTWSSWRSCSATCGTGEARRTRIIVQEAAHSGAACSGFFQEFRKCQDKPCLQLDCHFSAWEAWSSCSDRCTGHRQRRRSIEQQAIGGGEVCTGSTSELRPCGASHDTFCLSSGDAVDCIFGSWSAWSDCSRECGGGQQTATRQVLRHAGGAGKPCSGALQRVGACNLVFCPGDEPVECRLGDWSAWRPCTASCGGGELRRERLVATEPRNGGTPCADTFTSQVRPCNTQPCDSGLCAWTHWTAWGRCSEPCGDGERTRTRSMYRPDFASLEAEEAGQLGAALPSWASPQSELFGLVFLGALAAFWSIRPRPRFQWHRHEASYMPLSTRDIEEA